LKILLSKSAISKVYAAIIAIIVIVAIIAGALYYTSMPGPSPSPSASTTPSPSTSPSAARVLRYMHPTPWYIDPAVGSDLASSSSLVNIYDPLVYPQTAGQGGGVNPWVATNWTSSADGLTWTFSIRQGITFHSGRELNATDVAFSMNRLLTIGQGYAYLFSPYINSTVATDQWTVVFNFKRVFAPFLSALIRFWIVDSTTVIAHETNTGSQYGANLDYGTGWMDTHDAGSGPYYVHENSPEAFLDLYFFPNYWSSVGALHPTEVIVLAEPTSTTEQTMMTARDAEISSAWLPETTLEALQNVQGISIASIPEGDLYFYMMNTAKPPLDDVHVRKALAYCMNYTGMVATLYPRYIVATSCVPADCPGYADVSPYTYNLTMAQQELSLSKYANNISQYSIDFDWISAVPIREQDALFFASQALNIGVHVNVVSEEWAKFIQDVASKDTTPGMANVLVNTDYNEAGSLLEARYSSKSQGTWEQMEWLNDSTYDSMLEQALGELNLTQRFIDYANLQTYIMNICPSMFIYDYTQVTAYQNYVVWPMATSATNAFPCMGYNYDCRLIQINPH